MADEMFFTLLQKGIDRGLVGPGSVEGMGRLYLEERDRKREKPLRSKTLLLEVLLRADEEAILIPGGAQRLAVELRRLSALPLS